MARKKKRTIKIKHTKASQQKNRSRKSLRKIRPKIRVLGHRKIKILRERNNPKAFRAPKNAKELFALPRSIQEQWNDVVQVPSQMRATGLSLEKASNQLGVTPATVLRLAGSAFTKNRRGKVKVKRMDHLLRVLLIPSTKGLREVVVRSSREASKVGEYWNAVEKYLVKQDASSLQNLKSKSFINDQGKRVRLMTNLDELTRQASAGVFRFESIYGRTA
jgi:hypothetical protein